VIDGGDLDAATERIVRQCRDKDLPSGREELERLVERIRALGVEVAWPGIRRGLAPRSRSRRSRVQLIPVRGLDCTRVVTSPRISRSIDHGPRRPADFVAALPSRS
jgi:hypothetical protein